MEGRKVYAYEFSNQRSSSFCILSYGGTIQSWPVPNRDGTVTDIVPGFPTMEAYEGQRCFGALIGRCANRITHGVFTLNGKTYSLARSDSRTHTHLHGGTAGFNLRLWDGELQIFADRFTVNGQDNAADDRLIDAAGTPHDFRTPKRIGRDILNMN